MTYDFDQPVDRKNTNSRKWDKYPADVIPLWIADMDFQVANPIKDALQKLVDHAVVGYSHAPEELTKVVIERLKKRHNWEVKPEWIVWLPGLVPGLHASVRAIDDTSFYSVMTATPVYKPFLEVADLGKRRLMDIPFVWQNDRWEFDFTEMEKQIVPDTRVFMLCNPHNPLGRAFTKAELQQLADFCVKNDLVICSDEIHCDLILDKSIEHVSVAALNKTIENQSITLLAPSKTFNIAGLGCSFAVIPNDSLRQNFQQTIYGIVPHPSPFAFESALAAYRDSADWQEQVVAYLQENHDYLLKEINAIEGLEMKPLDATYLAWIEFDQSQLPDFINHLLKNGLGVMEAEIFGGKNAFRLNFATQRSTLEEVVKRLKAAVGALN
ncbi:MAG: PatB family C-S lyase [Spirosomaceae bacterium]|nr:PatB family C-S lyase [Spirosomataceae bacterium]